MISWLRIIRNKNTDIMKTVVSHAGDVPVSCVLDGVGARGEAVSQVSVIASDRRERGDLSSGTVSVARDCHVVRQLPDSSQRRPWELTRSRITLWGQPQDVRRPRNAISLKVGFREIRPSLPEGITTPPKKIPAGLETGGSMFRN